MYIELARPNFGYKCFVTLEDHDSLWRKTMPDKIKKLVRARMAKTGESYQTALRRIMAEAPKSTPAQIPNSSVTLEDHDLSDTEDHGLHASTPKRIT
jgi:hypothetical protein